MDRDNLLRVGGLAAGAALGLWIGLAPVIQLLLLLMVADFATGVVAGGVNGQLASVVSLRGMRKKVATLGYVGIASLLGHYVAVVPGLAELLPSGDVPLGHVAAGVFVVPELLSIVENLVHAGVNPPAFLAALLAPKTPRPKP